MLHVGKRRLLAVLGALWLVQAPAALAQDNTIVVTGRTQEQTQRFVERAIAAPEAVDQLARWDRTICTSVAGLPARQGQFLADRVAQRAYSVGLAPGEAGCTPNVAIIVTRDADAAARRMADENSRLFAQDRQHNVHSLNRIAFEQFLTEERPVRWWHVSETVSADGMALSGDAASGGMSNAPVARSGGSRLREDVRQDLNRAIIIVDAERVGDVQLAALADYIAMVALAQVDPNADMRAYPSVLNLFAGGGQTPAEMTEWDIAFLNGLYSATRNAPSLDSHRRDVARRMAGGGGA